MGPCVTGYGPMLVDRLSVQPSNGTTPTGEHNTRRYRMLLFMIIEVYPEGMDVHDPKYMSLRKYLNVTGGSDAVDPREERGFASSFVLVVLTLSMLACGDERDAEEVNDEYSPCIVSSDGQERQVITQWAPCVDWEVENESYSGNPFDVAAVVSFEHASSGDTITTHMFYDGGDTWKWRFTGTRTGLWTYSTASADPDLDGLTGEIEVTANPDPQIKGFLTHVGNRFAHMAGDDGTEREGYLFNVYMNGYEQPYLFSDLPPNVDDAAATIADYLNEARTNGTEIIFLSILNSWFSFGANTYEQHTSTNPDPATFRHVEAIISTVHSRGGRVHFWSWGDEERKWTPEGAGGINGAADRRLQRYIAARLGPLPGWTLGYGFDLHEWIDEDALVSWAAYLHDHFGWQHMLSARGVRLEGSGPNINGYASSSHERELETDESYGPHSFEEMLADMRSDTTRPHLYEERHTFERPGYGLDMDGTRRKLWWSAMAGGTGFFIGFYDRGVDVFMSYPYSHPEQLRTHYEFWQNHRRFRVDFQVDTTITDGLALRSPDRACYIFYKEDAADVRMDLSQMDGSRPAAAVDTRSTYVEIDLGDLNADNQVWRAPNLSDWAITVGCASDAS